jgi:hypothetical protein
MLTRDQILDADDLPAEEVHVPEWGGTVLVRGMTGAERDRFEMRMYLDRDKLDESPVRARVVAWCCLDEAGQALFSQKDVERLARKSGAALDRIFSVAQRLSRVDEKAAKAAEENFEPGRNGDSPSGWPDTSAALSASSSPVSTAPN